jgi:putative two-component system response regulator
MVSGVEDPKIVEKALEVGAYGYIIKPFNPSEVIINISSALRRQRLEIESRRHREDLEQLVEKRTASLRKAMQGIIRAISLTVESRDPYTSGHQHRVGTLSAAIAEEMGLPKDRIEGIRLAGMIHDLGKISVPAEILSKPTRLNGMEFGLIKTHPQVGYDILKGIDFPWPVAEITYQHHERLDGTGYPRRLKGEEILLEAKIMAVADVVEAMASHRPYRPSLGLDKALEEISDNAGKLYDPEVAKACRRVLRGRGFSFDL